MSQETIAYLAGPIDRVTTKDANTWRENLEKRLLPYGIECINPMTKYGDKIKEIRRQLALMYKYKAYDKLRKWGRHYIVTPDFEAVKQSDMIIMYLPSGVEVCGTYAELGVAFEFGIPIYIVSNRRRLPKWAIICSTEIYKNFDELCSRLIEVYK